MKNSLSELSDARLLELLSEESMLAFRAIYERYWKRLYLYAYKIFEDEHICGDVVQEIYLRLWEKRSSTQIDNLERYLFKSVKYKVANEIRNLKKQIDHVAALKDLPSMEVSANVMLEAQELSEQIERSIEHLPEKCRQVFKMSRADHLSNKEIAEKLNISVRTVDAHLRNALSAIRRNIQHVAIWLAAFLIN